MQSLLVKCALCNKSRNQIQLPQQSCVILWLHWRKFMSISFFKGKLPMDMHIFWLTRYYALWKQRRRLLGNWEERDVSSQDANHWCKTSVEDNWPCNLEALHCCTLIPPNGTLRSMTSACKLTRVIWHFFLGTILST